MSMKKFLLILILGAVCLIGYSQSYKPEIIFKLNQKNITVYRWKDSFFSPKILLEVVCRARSMNRDRECWFRRRADIFYNLADQEDTSSQFQNLYDWTIEFERFALNYNKAGDTIHLPISGTTLIAHKSNIHVYTMHTDCEPRSTMNLKNITEFKKRLIEYIKEHNISIRY